MDRRLLLQTIAQLPIDHCDTDFNTLIDPELMKQVWSDLPYATIGASRAGRPMLGLEVGHGPRTISIIAGSHADEPVGPMTALVWPSILNEYFPDLAAAFRFRIIPHMNPDGAYRNAAWYRNPPRFEVYWPYALRELPGDDVEFGFGEGPDVRPECAAAMAFMRKGAPFVAHFSLHGLAVGRGAWFLIDPTWVDRAGLIMDDLADLCETVGVPLHDEPRDGAKGFTRIREGFCTTPNSAAMRAFFHAQDDDATAAKFHPNSMEFARSLGGDPFCAVSELPLFLFRGDDPAAFSAFRSDLKARREDPAKSDFTALSASVAPMPIDTQMRLQIGLIVLSLQCLLQD